MKLGSLRDLSKKRIWKKGSLLVIPVLAFALSCSKKSGGTAVVLGEALIEFAGAQNSKGANFTPEDQALAVACDGLLTFSLGPQTVAAGLLDNWTLRPPHVCTSSQLQCGYFLLAFTGEDDSILAEVKSANIYPVVDTTGLDLAQITGATITLIDGNTDEPFLKDELPVSDVWSFSLTRQECPDGMNLGGMGGQGTTPEEPLGGAGGMGGAGLGGAPTGG